MVGVREGWVGRCYVVNRGERRSKGGTDWAEGGGGGGEEGRRGGGGREGGSGERVG